jgi:hypothetical protein
MVPGDSQHHPNRVEAEVASEVTAQGLAVDLIRALDHLVRGGGGTVLITGWPSSRRGGAGRGGGGGGDLAGFDSAIASPSTTLGSEVRMAVDRRHLDAEG